MRRTGHNAAIYTVAASLLRSVNKTAREERKREREPCRPDRPKENWLVDMRVHPFQPCTAIDSCDFLSLSLFLFPSRFLSPYRHRSRIEKKQTIDVSSISIS